ncbi:sensor domain-containing diguanylate cyclase [Vibrio metschnikovii]|nr:sensor domain-containing diguanylate cyclase [Vibrio metschnikovii]EKO3769465.1 sensor domain-containing diguanylate cyclase [Vibrio metschnikovii]
MSSSQAKYLTQFLIVLCILGCVPFLYFAHELAKLDHHTAQLPNAESTIAVDTSQFTVLNHHGDAVLHLSSASTHDANDPIADLPQQSPALWQSIQQQAQGLLLYQGRHYHFMQLSLPETEITETSLLIFNSHDPQTVEQQRTAKRHDLLVQAISIFLLLSLVAGSGVVWNITHQKNSLESKLALAAMNGMSAIVITDRQNRIIRVNQEFTRLSGYRLEEVQGKQPSIFASGKHNQQFYVDMWKSLQEDGFWEGEVINKRKDGSQLTEILRIQTILDDQEVIQYYVASFVDITQHKALENKLREQSEKDALTGIWNRRKFDQQIRLECHRVKRYPEHEHSCLAILDIDHFKRINDQFGHSHGDYVIQSVAETLRDGLRESDFLARIGGEEFAIILPHTPIEEAQAVIERLRIKVYQLHAQNVSISAGISDIMGSEQETYQRADKALYESKATGRNQVSILLSQEMAN